MIEMAEVNEAAFRDLERELQQEQRSERTVAAYHQGCVSLEKHLRAAGRPLDLLAATKDDVARWLIRLGKQPNARTGRPLAKDSICSYFSSVRRFYAFAAKEGMIEASPMATMKMPAPSDKPIEIPPDEDIRAMLASCRARSFTDLRDEAILRLFCEPGGPRISEMAGLLFEHVDMKLDEVLICGKGGKWRRVPMSARTARAMSRYLRARPRHPRAEECPQAFLGLKGRLSRSGVYQLVQRRCRLAGVPRIHPHQLRHWETDKFLAAGGAEGDMMRLNGWTSRKMLDRYGKKRAEDRAVAASRLLSLGNQL
jgi:site-specific recombinase XerD